MPHVRQILAALAVAVLLVAAARAEPLFTLSEDGRTFLYRARPGDHPGVVAEMFGIPARDVPAFLAANGIADPTRIGAGFTYRIPNVAARTLAERSDALEKERSRLARDLTQEKQRVQGLTRDASEARAAAAEAEEHAGRLARLDAIWPWAKAAIVILALAAAGAVYTAYAAIRRQGQAEAYARTLAQELDDKRKTGLAERQESARRVLDLENRIRALEVQIGPRVVISGRGNG